LQLKCFVCFPGAVKMGDMEGSLRAKLLMNSFISDDNLQHVKAEPMGNSQFATRGEKIVDTACQCAVHCTHAPAAGDRPQRTFGAHWWHATAAVTAEAATLRLSPPDAGLSPQPPASASCMADLQQTTYSALAAAGKEQQEELKASLCDSLDHARVLAVAKSALLQLEGLLLVLGRLARFADGVSQLVNGRGASSCDSRGPARFAWRK
jgi:hypothetical protein